MNNSFLVTLKQKLIAGVSKEKLVLIINEEINKYYNNYISDDYVTAE